MENAVQLPTVYALSPIGATNEQTVTRSVPRDRL